MCTQYIIILMRSGTETFYMIYLEDNMGKDDITWLSAEVEKWEKQGIIDEYQTRKILSTYGFAEAQSEPKPEPAKVETVAKEEGTSQIITIVSVSYTHLTLPTKRIV